MHARAHSNHFFLIFYTAVTVSFEMGQYSVLEPAGFQTVCVELSSGTVERRVVVSIASADVDAVGTYNVMYNRTRTLRVSPVVPPSQNFLPF